MPQPRSDNLALLCSCKAFGEGLRFSPGGVLFKKEAGDARGEKIIKKAPEGDDPGLVETSLHEHRVFRDTQEKKITVFYGFEDLTGRGLDILLEESVSARMSLPALRERMRAAAT